jgi:hypothetical protein
VDLDAIRATVLEVDVKPSESNAPMSRPYQRRAGVTGRTRIRLHKDARRGEVEQEVLVENRQLIYSWAEYEPLRDRLVADREAKKAARASDKERADAAAQALGGSGYATWGGKGAVVVLPVEDAERLVGKLALLRAGVSA